MIIIAANANQVQMMISDLMEAAERRGLKIHPGKTKVLTNASAVATSRVPKTITANGQTYSVLNYDESTKCLGRKVCYSDPHEVEFSNRVATAWGAFTKHKRELTDRRHRLHDRLKLFEAVVSSTLLYGCESWTLKVDQQRRLQVLQRKMLRMVLNVRRRTFGASADSNSVNTDTEDSESDSVLLEPWAEFLKRTAQWTQQQLENAGLSQWTAQWKRKKWQWAAKLVQSEVRK